MMNSKENKRYKNEKCNHSSLHGLTVNKNKLFLILNLTKNGDTVILR